MSQTFLHCRTGLKIFGEGEWLEKKHKTKRKRHSWRKLHLGLDLASGEIVCSDITKDDIGDPTALPDLLDQVDGPVSQFLGDGAYDGDPTSDLLAARFGSTIEVTIPPPKNAILSTNEAKDPTARDCHIADITARGRMAWQKATGYNQRSRVETLMGRWKTVIGPKLKARGFENQKTEAKIGVGILNRMTRLGRPNFERTA
ncbi:IS5 family transposase [Nisaea sp.]|uniref:IS5 family transposase n=1 Tax=Nisaea sp. TaxID=2024842 RepID=UPI0026C42C52